MIEKGRGADGLQSRHLQAVDGYQCHCCLSATPWLPMSLLCDLQDGAEIFLRNVG
jgi:hypothetical protein